MVKEIKKKKIKQAKLKTINKKLAKTFKGKKTQKFKIKKSPEKKSKTQNLKSPTKANNLNLPEIQNIKSNEVSLSLAKEHIEELDNIISLETVPTIFPKEEVKKMMREYAKTKDKHLREKLILMHIGLVHNVVKKFMQKGEPLRDIFQVGYVGLIQAFDRFDFNRGVEFITFATPTIVGEIKRYFRDKGWKIRIPRKIQELNLAIFRTLSELTQSLNHEPTVKEIALALKTTEEEVLEAMELGQAYNPISLNAKVVSSDEEDYPETLIDITGSVDAEIENLINKDALKKSLKYLNKVEKVIIYWRFYKNLTQYEIAKRLKMSQMQISRMQNRALHKIRNFIEGKEITEEEY